MVPPSRSMMRREMASPRPVPPNRLRNACVGLEILLEKMRQGCIGDADAGIADMDFERLDAAFSS